MDSKLKLEIVTPVYNEEKHIEDTIIGFFDEFETSNVSISFLISEDGSTDNSVKIINKLAKNYPIKFLTSSIRKNYTDAVILGLKNTREDILGFVDSDGQYDPKDLKILLSKLEKGKLVVGYRYPRVDNIFRKLISNSFKYLYSKLTGINLQDPSCGYFVGYKSDIKRILNTDNLGLLKEGFWWEFYARAKYLGIDIEELPIKHFHRNYGNTVVFKLHRIPKIGISNIIGLIRLSNILNKLDKHD